MERGHPARKDAASGTRRNHLLQGKKLSTKANLEAGCLFGGKSGKYEQFMFEPGPQPFNCFLSTILTASSLFSPR